MKIEKLKNIIFITLIIGCFFSCNQKNNSNETEGITDALECTLEIVNEEIAQLSTKKIILDSIFHLTESEIKEYLENSKIGRESRENIILKFIARLNDDGLIKTECFPTELLTLKIGDLAFYCLAKIEKFPFALATGRQNCTKPNISSEIWIPTNFIYYTQFEREDLTYNFLKYFLSKKRQELIIKEGYD